MRKADLVVSLVLIGFGIFYSWLITNLPTRNLPNTLGIDFMPWLLVVLLFGLSGLLLVFALADKSDRWGGKLISLVEARGVLALTLAVLVYVQLIGLLGYLIATPLFLALLMYLSGSRKPKEIIIVALAATGGIFLFFNKVFQIQLPGGNLL